MKRVGRFSIVLMGPDEETQETQETYNDFCDLLSHTEEDLNSEVPEGYIVRIDGK